MKGTRISVERRIGNILMTICVEEDDACDHNGRPLPPLAGYPRVTQPWTEIGRLVNQHGHDLINELCADVR